MRTLFSAGFAFLLAACFAAVWLLYDQQHAAGMQDGIRQALTAVVIGFAVNLAAAGYAVLFGVSRLELRLQRAGNIREFGPVVDFWTVPSPGKPWFILFGGQQTNDLKDSEFRVSFSTVFAFARISEIIKQLYGMETLIVLKCIRDIDDWDLVSSSNVVLLGGVVSIPKMSDVFGLLPLHARQEIRRGARQIVLSDGYASTVFLPKLINNLVVEDHALVTRTINPHNRSSLFTISGCRGAGTGAAAMAITSKAHFNASGFSKGASFHEVVVSA
ncbi:MAG: hypothetical protein JOY90_21600, partial [Bradyrhizobium sp.]|uniref:hypothetical protein n=1 Tax=Bradyrhizobium sp. TaxID=376 RepID=UPI001D283067